MRVRCILRPRMDLAGGGSYPQWYTKENILVETHAFARLEIDGSTIGTVDSDSDGLPDDWERFYFGNLGESADGDLDGDGATNLEEFRSGTNPKDAKSVFRLRFVSPIDLKSLRFQIHYAANRRYDLSVSSDLQQWIPVAPVAETFPAVGWIELSAPLPDELIGKESPLFWRATLRGKF